jgi:hypothetical protein
MSMTFHVLPESIQQIELFGVGKATYVVRKSRHILRVETLETDVEWFVIWAHLTGMNS